jgi:NitT/TauT family transport system substrate-binding protein
MRVSPGSRARFLAALGALPLAAGRARTADAQSTGPIRIAATANDTYAEAYYADAQGAFKNAGLDVAIQTFATGAPVTAAVAGSAADIGIAGAPAIGAAKSRGVPFIFIASGGLYTPSRPATVIVVATDGPIASARDFEGQNVAVGGIKDANWLGASAWIDAHGGDSTKVKFIELPYAEMGPAIKRGTVAAATISEPSQTRAIRSGGLRVFAHHFDVYHPPMMVGGWFTRTQWLADNPDAAKRFVAAIYGIAKWANANPSASAPILAAASKIDEETMRTMIRCQYGERLAPSMFQSQLDLAYKYKILDRAIDGSELIATI